MNFLQRTALYFHTLRYLRPVQVWGRVAFRFRQPRPDARPAPSLRKRTGEWQMPAARRASMLSSDRFRFLNDEHQIVDAGGWNNAVHSRLWTYNLHYFDDLNAIDAGERAEWHRSLISRWTSENPACGGPGWEPYPLSLRIANWIKWGCSGNELGEAAHFSLAVQVRCLLGRIEYHLLGNHLFANAKALIFAGCYFEGEEADAWFRIGMEILQRELPEQILPDGGHFERSTMYHALAYEDLLDVANLTAAYPDAFLGWREVLPDWRVQITRMGRWLVSMCHPDGEIAFFNDAAIGVSPSPWRLHDYARRLGLAIETNIPERVVWLKESGYIRAQIDDAVLIVDVAPVGPDYLPGHAHADTLSFEFSLGGKRLTVNSGTSRYGLGPIREWERSTAAHSTVEIDRHNSSEVWAGFRVARRAYPFDITIREANRAIVIEAAHDGYQRLTGRPVHRRSWQLNENELIVRDRIEGQCGSAIARYYFHPSINLHREESRGRAAYNGGEVQWQAEAGHVNVRAAVFSPEFGIMLDSSCLELEAVDGQMGLALRWQ